MCGIPLRFVLKANLNLLDASGDEPRTYVRDPVHIIHKVLT
jgi:hypothetical protein